MLRLSCQNGDVEAIWGGVLLPKVASIYQLLA
jgi:hypothetical protein